jgi:uncharacterized integral membrane protein
MSQPQVQTSGAKPKTSYVMPIIAGLIALALLAFVLQNTQPVKLSWLFWSFTWPLWLLLVVTIVLSLVAGQIMLMWRRHRRRVARRDARRG